MGISGRTSSGSFTDGSGCRRCGTCCRLGGPVLHREDLASVLPPGSVEKNGFGLADLVTLRAGELVRDDVARTLAPLDTECVKLDPVEGDSGWACRFLGRDAGAPAGRDAVCRIHSVRPAQCRALSCTDTRKIAALYTRDRIVREDILRAVEAPAAWREVPAAHEDRCSVRRMAELAHAVPWSKAPCRESEELVRLLRFDIAFRQLCVERGHIPEAYLLFLLGRPMVLLLAGFGLRFEQTGNMQGLVRVGPDRYAMPEVMPKGR